MSKHERTEMQYLVDSIKTLRAEASSVFHKIQWRHEHDFDDSSKSTDDYYEESRLEYQFEDLSQRLFIQTQLFIEKKELPIFLEDFRKKISPFLQSKKALLEGDYHEEAGEAVSTMLNHYWDFLSGFYEFEYNNEALMKLSGLTYLENVLGQTAVILKQRSITPKKETDVTRGVIQVVKNVFLDHAAPKQAFIKKAQGYVPDILVPSLYAAVEYKYGESEKKLVATLNEILIDVHGYDKNPDYHNFYAVFYVKPGVSSVKRFKELWEEKEFPENWKWVYVEGN
jgi:hypothetical protein